MPAWRGVTPSADALVARMAERQLPLYAKLLCVQVVTDQARDERALLVTALDAVALETLQLFVVEQYADFRSSWFPQLAIRQE